MSVPMATYFTSKTIMTTLISFLSYGKQEVEGEREPLHKPYQKGFDYKLDRGKKQDLKTRLKKQVGSGGWFERQTVTGLFRKKS